MPINVGEVETHVDVERGSGGGPESTRTQATPETLQRWQEIARRGAELAHRTAAWAFDD